MGHVHSIIIVKKDNKYLNIYDKRWDMLLFPNIRGNSVADIINYIENNFAETEHTKEKLQELVKNAIEYANMVVYEKSKEIEQFEGMGTTIVLAVLTPSFLLIGNIGDSSGYIYKK